MRGIIVDPAARTVSWAVEPEGFGLAEMYRHLSPADRKVVSFDSFSIEPRRERCWLDDTGHEVDGNPIWWWGGYGSALAGRGLILGLTEEGDNASTSLSLEEVRANVQWDERVSAGVVVSRVTEQGYALEPTLRALDVPTGPDNGGFR